MNSTSGTLDAEELLHLALKASQQNRSASAIDYLKRAIEISFNFAKAHYLLGALHAEIGMYERAAEEMTKAIELEPELDAAQFQLGLLYITGGNLAKAEESWKALDKLGDQHPFYLFKEGMIDLAKDRFVDCIEKLESGIALNTINEALNNDMRRVIERARTAIGQSSPQAEQDDKELDSEQAATPNQMLLSAYQQSDENKH